MKVALAQLNSNDDLISNLKTVESFIKQAASENASMVFFPENTLFFRISASATVVPVSVDGPELKELAKICKMTKVAVHLTTAVKEGDSVYNASVFIDDYGLIRKVYDKIHLFDIELTGQAPIRESDSFKHGKQTNVFEFKGFKFASSICYDIRFAELYSEYARQEVDAILIPSAFLVKTGQAHWEVLLRARAIESQCYVLAPAQHGRHKSINTNVSRETYGHTSVIGPWGEISALLKEGGGLLYFDLNKEEIKKVRTQIPMRNHRKLGF